MTYGRSSKKPTVGRIDDPLWVAEATYRGSLFAPSTTNPFALLFIAKKRREEVGQDGR